jgi:hypothetical protein
MEATCPACNQAVDTTTEAHVSTAEGEVFHAECYDAQVDTQGAPLSE